MAGQWYLVLAGLTEPIQLGPDPWSLLWILPLSASVAIVYKATKLKSIEPKTFVKEAGLLFLSIVAFMAMAGTLLCLTAWFLDEQLPRLLGY